MLRYVRTLLPRDFGCCAGSSRSFYVKLEHLFEQRRLIWGFMCTRVLVKEASTDNAPRVH